MRSLRGAWKPAGLLPDTFPLAMPVTSPQRPASVESPASTGPPAQEAACREETRPRAVIIGAGLGGLSAGIHLARRGWKVDILERNARSGGRMNVLEQDGFRIDMGPTMLMMPEVIEGLFAACGREMRDYLNLQRIAPAYRICWPDGSRLDMGQSVAEMTESLRRFSPEDAAQFPALVAKMRAKYLNARHNFIEQPFNSLRDLLRPGTLAGLYRSLPLESVYSFVSRYLRDEKLRQAFTFQTLYLGISPYDCPAIYALLPYIEMEYGVWFPQGGAGALAEALERLLRELGGAIHFCRSAERILLEGRRAVGVRDSEGNGWHADVVISNLDLPTTYTRLLPSEARRKHTDAALARREYGCSGYLLYLGVKKLASDWGHNIILLSDDYAQVLEDVCHTKRLPRDPAMHVCIPTRSDPMLAPEGHDVVYVLVPCPNTQGPIDWESEGPAFRERVLDKLEATGLPGLRQHIVFERAFTPPEFEARYGCYAGAAFGSLTPAFLQSAYFRPHSRSEDVRGLYFVGAGTHPGGGVPIVLTSGRLAAEDILASTRK